MKLLQRLQALRQGLNVFLPPYRGYTGPIGSVTVSAAAELNQMSWRTEIVSNAYVAIVVDDYSLNVIGHES